MTRAMTRAMTRVGLRRASIDDAAKIARIYQECFVDQPWSRKSIELMLADRVTFGYMAEQSQTGDPGPVGFCLARIARDECELLSLGVLHEFRGLGLGRHLVKAVKGRAKDRCCARIYLEVAESNSPAMQLYLKCGFAVVGRRKGYYRTSKGLITDALVMATAERLA